MHYRLAQLPDTIRSDDCYTITSRQVLRVNLKRSITDAGCQAGVCFRVLTFPQIKYVPKKPWGHTLIWGKVSTRKQESARQPASVDHPKSLSLYFADWAHARFSRWGSHADLLKASPLAPRDPSSRESFGREPKRR